LRKQLPRIASNLFMKFGRHSSFLTGLGIRVLSAGLLLLISGLLSSNVFTAEITEEQQLIQTLRSNASLAEKDAACARLKFIGTARCVPAIAPLLLDEQLSHSARYALESLDVAEAGAALLDALNQTKGLTQVGIINSLGARHERRAVPALEKILLQPTPEPASTIAAARALGKISGASALRSLEIAEKLATGPLRAAIADAMLRCANDLLLAGSASKAKTVFELLSAAPESPAVRVAAYRGLIRSSGNRGLSLMLHALGGPPGPERLAALQLAH
jgi:HEAT repeat protein